MTKESEQRLLRMAKNIHNVINSNTQPSYWEKESRITEKLSKENDQIEEELRMSGNRLLDIYF